MTAPVRPRASLTQLDPRRAEYEREKALYSQYQQEKAAFEQGTAPRALETIDPADPEIQRHWDAYQASKRAAAGSPAPAPRAPGIVDRERARQAGYSDAEIDEFERAQPAPPTPRRRRTLDEIADATLGPMPSASREAIARPSRSKAFAAESTGARTTPRTAGDVGVIDPLGMGANALQGASFEFADEGAGIVGGLAALARGKSYSQGHTDARTAFTGTADRYAAQHAGGAALSKITGAAVPALLSLGASAPESIGAATLSQLARTGAKTGAAYGAAAGVGSGDGLSDRVGRGVVGAAVGGVAGAVLPAVAVGAARAPGRIAATAENVAARAPVLQPVARKLSDLARSSDRMISRATGASAETAIPVRTRQAMDAVSSRLDDGAFSELRTMNAANVADDSPEMLAAMVPENAQRTFRAADALSDNGATRTALTERLRQQGPNLANRIDGPEITSNVTLPALKAEAQQRAESLFETAHAAPDAVAPEVLDLFNTPLGKSMYERARTKAANDLRWRSELPAAETLQRAPAEAAEATYSRIMQGDGPLPPLPNTLSDDVRQGAALALEELRTAGQAITPELEQRVTAATFAAREAADAAQPTMPVKVLHWWKIEYDDAIEQAIKQGDNGQARILGQHRDRLMSVLRDEERAPSMAEALRAYEIPMANADAVHTALLGDPARLLQSATNAPPRAVKAELAQLASGRNPQSAQWYRDAGKQAVRDHLAKIRPDRDVTKVLFPDGPKDELLQALLSPEQGAAFGRQLGREQRTGTAADNILRNSSTARNAEDLRTFNTLANGGGALPLSRRGTSMAEDVVQSGSIRAPLLRRAAEWLGNRRELSSREVAREVDRLGTLSGPELAQLLDQWEGRAATVYRPAALRARMVGRVAGSSSGQPE